MHGPHRRSSHSGHSKCASSAPQRPQILTSSMLVILVFLHLVLDTANPVQCTRLDSVPICVAVQRHGVASLLAAALAATLLLPYSSVFQVYVPAISPQRSCAICPRAHSVT